MTVHPQTKVTFLQQHGQKLVALALWASLVGAYFWYVDANQVSWPAALVRLQGSVSAPLIYIGLYALRPLLFLPSTPLSVVSGVLFGPVAGILYTILASNLSAMLAYLVGRYFGQDVLIDPASTSLIQRYSQRLRNHSFETILMMRLIFLPYDLVNYGAGLLHIDWKAFLLATALGSFPGTLAFVLLGAAGNVDLVNGTFTLHPGVLLASVVLIGVSFALARFVKRRKQLPTTDS